MENAESASGRNRSRLMIVLGLTLLYLIAEVVAGLLTKSLALLADAGHMLTDVAGLGMALLAIWFAAKPATPERTFGYYRVEILAAMANAVVLLGISGFVLYEAYFRLLNPPEVASKGMLVVAVIGLVVNIAGVAILRSGSSESLNMKGAYFEVLSDALTSIGVIVAAVIMWTTGWYYADPLLSAGIGLFILPRTWILLKDAVAVLLEGTPSEVDLDTLRDALVGLDGVDDVHDLHAWSLTSGINALSVHVVVTADADHRSTLIAANRLIIDEFPIQHSTIQIEPPGFRDRGLRHP